MPVKSNTSEKAPRKRGSAAFNVKPSPRGFEEQEATGSRVAADSLSTIRILPDRVANQIAAGEVIERPVAVIKELVENSLDAGATRIEIEFRNGGKSYMRVDDNGCGMSPDDGLMALERHATSKIREASDLAAISTFGFRGEALSSVASVSRFTLRSRSEGFDHGTEVLVNGGKYIHSKECGMPTGTSIEVAHLFNSVPVRRKFLKTDNTEAAHIIHLARLYAVANPSTSFTLLENGRTVFMSPVCTRLRDRISEIFGQQVTRDLIEINAEEGDFSLRGLIGKPGVGRSTRQEMVTYVNVRPVDSKTINFALIEAYHTYVPKGRYPLCFLFLRSDPGGLDVNVHPAKREIRFREEGKVRHFIISSVLERLREASGSPTFAETNPSSPPVPVFSPLTKGLIHKPPSAAQTESRKGEEIVAYPPRREEPRAPLSGEVTGRARSALRPPSLAGGPDWRYLGVAHEAYAIFETGAGILLLHRRGALERIFFENILERLKGVQSNRQKLLFPIPLELDPRLAATLVEHAQFLESKGFDIEPFGRNFFRVEALPDWLDPAQGEDFLRDLIGLIRERGLHPDRSDIAYEEIARRAASLAARVSPAPTKEEMRALARDLLKCDNPLTDPHGYPTLFEISRTDLEKRFGK